MGRKAKPVAPIFQPEVPARAIVFAATHHRRDIWLGIPTIKAILVNRIAPGLIDRYLARTGYSDQWLPADAPSNLFEPVPGDYGAHGRFDSRATSTTWTMFTDRHRAALWAGAAGLVGLLGLHLHTVFQKTLALSDFYFGSEDYDYPLGLIQMCAASHGEQIRGEAVPSALQWLPELPFDKLSEYSMNFWLQSEDLPRPENRIAYEGDRVVLSITDGNGLAARGLKRKLESLLGVIGAHPVLLERSLYLGKDIPINGTASLRQLLLDLLANACRRRHRAVRPHRIAVLHDGTRVDCRRRFGTDTGGDQEKCRCRQSRLNASITLVFYIKVNFGPSSNAAILAQSRQVCASRSTRAEPREGVMSAKSICR